MPVQEKHGHLEKLEPGGKDSQNTVLSPLGLKGLCRVVGATLRDLCEPDKLRSDH